LGHAYLYIGDVQNAIATYKKYIKESIKPGLSFEQLLKQDYTYFKDHQYNVQAFDLVFKELNVSKP
jgi:hypothetical protein